MPAPLVFAKKLYVNRGTGRERGGIDLLHRFGIYPLLPTPRFPCLEYP